MSFIDWSDAEAMLGLLVEWVADERGAARDSARADFLAGISAELSELADRQDLVSLEELIESLRALYERRAEELPGDPALLHLADCIDEMERLRAEAPDRERER